ncbi:MAG: hypothetical protein ACPKQO_00920, partial [Nitrososphaeraceae archaeon]
YTVSKIKNDKITKISINSIAIKIWKKYNNSLDYNSCLWVLFLLTGFSVNVAQKIYLNKFKFVALIGVMNEFKDVIRILEMLKVEI